MQEKEVRISELETELQSKAAAEKLLEEQKQVLHKIASSLCVSDPFHNLYARGTRY